MVPFLKLVVAMRKALKSKINILFFIDYLYGFGGTEKYLFNLTTRLDPNVFDCTVCPFRFSMEMVRTFEKAGIRVEPAQLERIYGITAFRQAIRIRGILKNLKIDIVQTFNLDSDIFGTLVAKLAGIPLIISNRRDLGVYRKKRHLLVTRRIFKYVDYFLAVCHAAASELAERERVPPEKITTIHNGFDMSDLSLVDQKNVASIVERFKIGSNSFVIGNVSHLRPEKGHRFFIDAIRKVRPIIPDLRVLIVGGDGPALRPLQAAIVEHRLSETVFLTGYVENVLDYVSLMDVCCLTPISNEGFSNAVLEQMAMGKPVIATDVGGNREAISNGVSGIIVPPQNGDAVAEAILKLYRDDKLRNLIGREAKERVEKDFSIQKMIVDTEDFYYGIWKRSREVVSKGAKSTSLVPQ